MRCNALIRLVAMGLSICGAVGCHAPDASPQEMRNLGIKVVIESANASSDPNLVRYTSIADFIRRNPNCCALHRLSDPEMMVWNVELNILYRRQVSGPEPFYQATFQFGPKPENFEDSGSPLSAERYQLLVTHRQHEQIIR